MQAGGDPRLGDERGLVLRLLEILLVHRLHHCDVDVEADKIHQAEGPEPEARRVDQDAVDGGEVGDAFGVDAQRLGDERAPGVIDDEAWRVLAADRRMAVALGERGERLADPRLGEYAVDDFHDFHHRHRVEEVVARDAAGALAYGSHGSDGERRGVAREDALVAHDRFQLGKERALGDEVLDDRFDHQVAGRERRQARHPFDAPRDRVRIVDASLFGEPRERLRD